MRKDTSSSKKRVTKKPALKDSGKPSQQQAQLSDESHSRVGEIEYYDDSRDTGNYFVCIDRRYIFAANGNVKSPQWEILGNEDGRWDSAHQRIYRNCRADKILRDDLPAHFPVPPDSIPPEALMPVVNQAQKISDADDYSALIRYIEGLEEKALSVYLVLYEDKYESVAGDGEFHYPQEIFFDRVSAELFMRNGNQAYKYHLRKILIRLRDGVLDCPEMELMTFDRFSDKDVLSMVNKQITLDGFG